MGLLSFMTSEEGGTGSIKESDAKRRKYAKESIQWNRNEPKFREMFPELL